MLRNMNTRIVVKSNRETASGFLNVLAGLMLARGDFGQRLVRTHRRTLDRADPAELREHARGLLIRARREARSHLVRGRVYELLSAIFELAAEPEPASRSSGCCRILHPDRMSRGLGDRRSDCARFSACLTAFVKSTPREETAHCPAACGSFVELRRKTETHRDAGFWFRASVAGDGRAGTGIY